MKLQVREVTARDYGFKNQFDCKASFKISKT
jgi:hypothetical protein